MLLFSWIYILKTYFFCYLIIRFLVLSRVEGRDCWNNNKKCTRFTQRMLDYDPFNYFFCTASQKRVWKCLHNGEDKCGIFEYRRFENFSVWSSEFPTGSYQPFTRIIREATSHLSFELWHFSCVQYGRTIRIIEETTLFSALSLCTHGPSTHLDRK